MQHIISLTRSFNPGNVYKDALIENTIMDPILPHVFPMMFKLGQLRRNTISSIYHRALLICSFNLENV